MRRAILVAAVSALAQVPGVARERLRRGLGHRRASAVNRRRIGLVVLALTGVLVTSVLSDGDTVCVESADCVHDFGGIPGFQCAPDGPQIAGGVGDWWGVETTHGNSRCGEQVFQYVRQGTRCGGFAAHPISC